jgi:hypothetical protein
LRIFDLIKFKVPACQDCPYKAMVTFKRALISQENMEAGEFHIDPNIPGEDTNYPTDANIEVRIQKSIYGYSSGSRMKVTD